MFARTTSESSSRSTAFVSSVSATGRRGGAAQLLHRLESVADLISLHKQRSEEPLRHRAVERGGVVEWDHMRGVRENGELAIRDVIISTVCWSTIVLIASTTRWVP